MALGFSSVYREGFETVLFLQALTLEAGAFTVLQGVALGFAAVVAVFLLVIALERRLPHKKMLVATGVLITWVLVVLVGQTVQTMQEVGWVAVTPVEGLSSRTGPGCGSASTRPGRACSRRPPPRSSSSAATSRPRRCASGSARGSRSSPVSDFGRTPSALPANLPGEVRQLRFEELLPRERNGFRRAGDRDEHGAAVGAGGGAREHRG